MKTILLAAGGLLLLGTGGAGAQDFEQQAQRISGDISVAARHAQSEAVAAALRTTAAIPSKESGGEIPAAYLTAEAPARDSVDGESYCMLASLKDDPELEYCVNEREYRGFTLTNRLSPRVNPAGGGVRRSFKFIAPRSARQEMGVLIDEWGTSDESASDSAWSMLTELVFFPREVLPSVRLGESGAVYEVTIPTGEKIIFDAKTKEIVGGVLEETSPIDRSENRYARKFAGLRYRGNGVMVRVDQRGESPRSALVWGQKKTAVAVWHGKPCRLSPADIWHQDADGSGGVNLYPSDAEFYVVLRRKCGWDLGTGHRD